MVVQTSFARGPLQQSPPGAKYSSSSSSFRDPDLEPSSPQYGNPLDFPPPEMLLMNYKNGINGQLTVTPPSSTAQPRSSDSLNTSDPIAMHLLVETALGDAKEFEVLSFEELEELKREDTLITSRIDAVRRKLALETKVRDAAKSLNRLYSSPCTSPKLGRRSFSGETRPKRSTTDRTEMELAASIKKCDELSRELYHLEQRSRATQSRLLKHTAGILQMTYRQPKRRKYEPAYPSNGRPESPASLDGFDRTFDDLEVDSLFRTPDILDGFLDEMRADRPRRRLSFRSSRDAAAQRKVLIDIGNRLDRLNRNVRDVITSTASSTAAQYAEREVPEFAPAGANIDGSISQQLDYLSQGLQDIRTEQGFLQQRLLQAQTGGDELVRLQKRNAELQSELQTTVKAHGKTHDDMTRRLRNINANFVEILESNGPADIPPLPIEEDGLNDQMDYTQRRAENLRSIVQSLTSGLNADKAAQYDVVLQGLWQIIIAGEEETRRRKLSERKQFEARRAAGDRLNSDDELSPDEGDDLKDEFSLPAFSTKVQWLISKSANLKQKQGGLKAQLRQHREALDRAASPSRDPDVQKLRMDYERTSEQYATAKEEFADLEKRLALRDEEAQSHRKEVEKAVQEAREDARLAMAELQANLEMMQAKVQGLQVEVDTASLERQDAGKALSEKNGALQKAQSELQDLESEVVRLTTELTIAKADLDASYGSRQQRAADWAAAANTEATAKLDDVNKRNAQLEAEVAALAAQKEAASGSLGVASVREEELRRELEGTLAEFEELTRASVEAEKEREKLEAQVDKLRDLMEGLETQLYDEKVKWMGIKSPAGVAGPEGPTQSMGTAVLKGEFKKMMRDTRSEHLRALRAEQEERRKLEAQLRSLRKEQGPIKSALNKSMTS